MYQVLRISNGLNASSCNILPSSAVRKFSPHIQLRQINSNIFPPSNGLFHPKNSLHLKRQFSTSSFKPQDTSQSDKSHHQAHNDHHHHFGGFVGAKHQVQHRVKEKVGMKIAQTATGKVVPRLIGMLKGRLAVPLIMRKVARGVAMAIPAVGGICAVIVATMDGKRTLQALNSGQRNVALSFGSATFCDIVDAAAHALVAVEAMELLHISHHTVHLAEHVSLGAAIVATSAAVVGEFLTPMVLPLPNFPHPTPQHNTSLDDKTSSATAAHAVVRPLHRSNLKNDNDEEITAFSFYFWYLQKLARYIPTEEISRTSMHSKVSH